MEGNPVELTVPTAEQATRIMREVSWEERIEGEIFEPGPGAVTERLYQLVQVRNMLKGMRSFSVPPEVLINWVGETLSDPELAAQIRLAADQFKWDMDNWVEDDEAPTADAGASDSGLVGLLKEIPEAIMRRKIVALLTTRIDQCLSVLNPDQGQSEQTPA